MCVEMALKHFIKRRDYGRLLKVSLLITLYDLMTNIAHDG